MSASWFSGGSVCLLTRRLQVRIPAYPGFVLIILRNLYNKTISKKKKDKKKKFEGKINKAIVTRTRVGFMFAAVGASVC